MAARLAGAPGLTLTAGVAHLDPPRAVFEGMLEGWTAQMTARGLQSETIETRLAIVRRLAVFTNDYPWHWMPADAEEFAQSLCSGDKPVARSTLGNYENQLGLFLAFVTDPRYEWAAECEARFGTHPIQIFHADNVRRHRDEYEGRPERRALRTTELQRLFDHADSLVENIGACGRKGSLAAARDACLMKVIYGWGLRRREAVMLDLADLHRYPGMDRFGDLGALHVRYGKAKRGGSPRRRTVASLFDWAVDALEYYLTEVRPLFDPGALPALWVTERRTRLSRRSVDNSFARYRDAGAVAPGLDVHCLRHSYATYLAEAGYPERFIADQLGHTSVSTTATYESVSDDFKNQVVARALAGAFEIGAG